MKKFMMFIVSLIVLTLNSTAATAANKTEKATGRYDWTSVMEALIQVESEGNAKAKSGSSVGVLQITPILVAECNNVLKQKGSKKRYTLADRYSVAKSKEMFLLMQETYNPQNNVERAIRAWNGGNHYSVKRTQRYYQKVMKVLKSKKN